MPDTPCFLSLTPEEQNCIRCLYDELDVSYWRRYRALTRKQRRGVITQSERDELLSLIEQGEEWNVRRLTYLFALAKHYEQNPSDFLDILGLRHHPLSRRSP